MVPAAVGIGHRRSGRVVDVLAVVGAGIFRLARVLVGGKRAAGVDLPGGNAGRGEHLVVDIGFVGLPRRLFDDHAQKHVADVGVVFLRAGSELQRLAQDVAGRIFDAWRTGDAHLLGAMHVAKGQVAGDVAVPAPLVLEQLLDSDVLQAAVAQRAEIGRDVEDAAVAVEVEDLVVQAEHAVFGQLVDGRGGHRLGDTGQPHQGGFLHRRSVTQSL